MKVEPNEVDSANVQISPSTRKKQFFYEFGADATLHFRNGDTVRVNKTILAFHSQIFYSEFFGSTPKSNTEISDFDTGTFKLFLDCLLGFENYSMVNALLIYPIAHKYDVESSLKGCLKVLQPPNNSNEMNKHVCLALNLALLYNFSSLADNILKFLKNKFGILNLLEREDYCFLLEPASMSRVIEHINMNSFVLTILYKWGKNYLKIHSKSTEILCPFLKKRNILPIDSLSIFESVQSIFDFHETSQKKFYTSDEILYYLKGNVLQDLWKFPNRSSWVKVKKGDIVKEKINFKSFLSFPNTSKDEITLAIWRNDIMYDDIGKDNEVKLENRKVILNYEWYYSYNNELCAHVRYHDHDNYTSSVYKCTGYSGYTGQKSYSDAKIQNFKHRISSVDVTYMFHVDCWILKTSIDVIPFAVDNNQLYYTCGIEFH